MKLYRIKKSNIDKKGLYATKDIKVGTRVIQYKGKIITIFGCGGERDFFKRKYMGKIAEEISDFQIITNDNPRNEDPKKIFSQITSGMKSTDYKIIFDRKEAIFEGLKKLKTLERDSVLLIAGKGHENTQITVSYTHLTLPTNREV